MRRLRFPVELEHEESIPGALARGVRLNVLERSSIAFEDTGLAFRKGGQAQVMPFEELEVLARWMRCDPALLTKQAIHIAGDSKVVMGDLVLESGDIQLLRRRIAPITLATRPYHRMAWLSTLLPYCPVSLERLVDTCPRCEIALGWSRCWGIGDCERCREQVPPSEEPGLPDDMARDYRLFATLLSPVADIRRDAIATLPERLRRIAPGSLVQMAIRLGETCREKPVVNVRRECVKKLAPTLIAEIVSRGTGLLRDWPFGFTAYVASAFEHNIDNLKGYHSVRKLVRRLGHLKIEDSAQAELVREALPAEFVAFARSAPASNCMTLLDMRSVQHLNPVQLQFVRTALEDRRLPGRKVIRSQFNPEKVKAFSDRYRNSDRLRSLTFDFMLPTYAIEQMVCLELLVGEDDELVRQARGGACVASDAGIVLAQRIAAKARRKDIPENAVSLSYASRRIGGREKPWGEIFKQLRDGAIPFWLDEDSLTARTIKVLPFDLLPFQNLVFRREDHPEFPFGMSYAKCEVEEILNMSVRRFQNLIDRGDIEFRPDGVRHAADARQVTDLAARIVSFAELSAHTGWSHRHAIAETIRLVIPSIGKSWCRPSLVAHGLIPPLPDYRPTFPKVSAYRYTPPSKKGGGGSDSS